MKRVIVESPYRGKTEKETEVFGIYLLRALEDSLRKDEAPFASHVIYPLVLDDRKEDERTLGIEAGFAWGEVAEGVAVYNDYGISEGMLKGIEAALKRKQVICYRSIGKNSI